MNFTDQDINKKIRSIVKDAGIPLKNLAEALSLTKSEILRWWAHEDLVLGFNNLKSLGHYLGTSSDALMSNSVSSDFIRRRIFNGPTTLPEKYSISACSHVRTSAHIIEYLSMVYGRHFSDEILIRLNIHPLFFENLENKINLNFFIDVFNLLHEKGISDREIASLASYIFLRIRGSSFGTMLEGASNHQEFYEVLTANATSMETNFEYSLNLGVERLQVIARPTEALELLSDKTSSEYQRFFLYRHNVFNWFPILGGLSPLSMHVKKCVLRGDSETVYEAQIPRSLRPHQYHLLS